MHLTSVLSFHPGGLSVRMAGLRFLRSGCRRIRKILSVTNRTPTATENQEQQTNECHWRSYEKTKDRDKKEKKNSYHKQNNTRCRVLLCSDNSLTVRTILIHMYPSKFTPINLFFSVPSFLPLRNQFLQSTKKIRISRESPAFQKISVLKRFYHNKRSLSLSFICKKSYLSCRKNPFLRILKSSAGSHTVSTPILFTRRETGDGLN